MGLRRIPVMRTLTDCMRFRAALCCVSVLGLAASGCRGCNEEQPFTPFGIASVIPTRMPTPSAAPSDSAGPSSFQPQAAMRAPAGATRWALGGTKLDAPPGRCFALGLSSDFDGDQRPDAVAWTLPVGAHPTLSGGQLWIFPANGAPHKLTEQAAFVPTGPGCRPSTTLTQTGPRSVTVDTQAQCETNLITRAAVRAITVVTPGQARPILLTLRVARAAPGEVLTVRVDSTDQDGDGLDDVSLGVTVQRQNSQHPATLPILWLDRAAGPSRQPHEPRATLARRAGLELLRAKGKNTSRTVPDAVGNLRRLLATVCRDGGTARVFDSEGAAFSCGPLQRVVDRLAEAEVVAALTRGAVEAAFGALARDGWHHTRASTSVNEKLTQAVLAAVTRVEPAEVLSLDSRPIPRIGTPRWSPLRFRPEDGSLLVQTASGLVEVASQGDIEHPLDIDAGVAAWPLPVSMPDGSSWTGIAQACNRSEVLLTFLPPRPEQVTHLLAARPGACAGGMAPAISAPAPLEHRQGTLCAMVAAEVVGTGCQDPQSAGNPAPPGSSRSPDGRLTIRTTPLGLLVTGDDPARLWDAPELSPWTSVSDCVVANAGHSVACIRDGRVWLLRQ